MATTWTTQQRLDVATAVLGGLLSNTVLVPTAADALLQGAFSVQIANDLLNNLAGVVVDANATNVIPPTPPSTIIRADGLV